MTRIEKVKLAITTHGDTANGETHPIYRAYGHMMERCYKPNTKHYHAYGGSGVTVCDEWKNNYISFRTWSIENGWEKGLEIDKDGVNKDAKIYSPETCRWVTHAENCKHRVFKVGKTGFRGVSEDKRKHRVKRFFGQKTINGKRYATKYFSTPKEAYDELSILIKGINNG